MQAAQGATMCFDQVVLDEIGGDAALGQVIAVPNHGKRPADISLRHALQEQHPV
jgi:hypothetical protein